MDVGKVRKQISGLKRCQIQCQSWLLHLVSTHLEAAHLTGLALSVLLLLLLLSVADCWNVSGS